MSLFDQANLSEQPGFQSRVAAAAVTAAVNIASEVTIDQQTISMGAVTAGTFTLSINGQTTAAIQWNAAASAVQAALNALTTLGAGAVECTGGPLPGTPVVVNFNGTAVIGAQPLMTHTDTLTGGSASIAHTTVGTWVAFHAKRQALASKIVANPQGYGQLIAAGVAANAAVLADFPAPNYTGQALASTQNGTLTNNSAVVTGLQTNLLTLGQPVTGTGVPTNTTVLSIDSATQIHLSANATVSGAESLTFAAVTQSEAQITNDIQFQVNSIFNAYT